MSDMTGFILEKKNAIAAMRDFVTYSEYPKATPEILKEMKKVKTPEELHDLQRKAGFAV